MKVIVTTGPSYEPVDEVRRLTNFSTGELGLRLAAELARAGFEVICLKGVAATHPVVPEGADVRPFTTNDDLWAQCEVLAREGKGKGEEEVGAVFHVAALCDFKIKRVEDAGGRALASAKIDSRAGELTLVLEPARKVIAGMRDLFPRARIVGWKYELVGGRTDALGKAWRQLQENRTDACVVNGRAWGEGFGFCTLPDQVAELSDKTTLVTFLTRWLAASSGLRPSP